MKVLVTGAQGFIGSHLVERLYKNGVQVVGIDKKDGTSTVDQEMIDGLVDNFRPDFIVHLGANCSSQISLRDPRTDFRDNVVGTFNVLEASRKSGGIPVIFNSTMKVYPGEDGIISPYGVSKITGEYYLRLYQQVYGIDYIINRPSSVYGPRQDGSDDGGWFTWFIIASLTNQQINLYGDGSQSRDVLYVDDHIDLFVDQLNNFDRYKNNEYDFGGGLANEVSLNELLAELDYHNTVTKDRLQGDVQRFVCDNSKIMTINGWQPKTSWQQGLHKTKEYFSEVHRNNT